VAAGGADLAHHHEPGVDPHPDGQADPVRLLQAGMQPLHRGNGSKACPHGALGVVFVRLGIAKVDQQAIAKVLGNVPVEALDDLGTRSLVRPDHRPIVLRVEPSGEGGRAHQIAEHHGQLPAFGVRGFGGGRWWCRRGDPVVWLPVWRGRLAGAGGTRRRGGGNRLLLLIGR